MAKRSHSRSRQSTPWDRDESLTPVQEFLRMHYKAHYAARHPKLSETGEAALIKSFIPAKCPYCGSVKFKKRAKTANGGSKVSVCLWVFFPADDTHDL